MDLDVARALASGRVGDALDTHFQPLTGALVAPLVALGAAPEPAAQLLVVVVSSLVAPLCALAAAMLVVGRPGARPLRAAALAGLIAAAQPYLARLGGQVMAYGPAHAALALALLLAVLVVRRPTARRAAALGAAIGLGYLARTDALATGAGLAAGVALATAAGTDGRLPARARRAAGITVALGLGLLLAAGPFLVLLRLHGGEWRLSLKKRVSDVLAVKLAAPVGPAPARPAAPDLAELVRAEETGGDLERARDGESTRLPLLAASGFALRKAVAAANEEALALAVLGALALGASRRAPGGAAWVPAPLALLTFVAAHALLKASVGYTSKIHLSAAGVLVAPLAGVGLDAATARLRRGPALVALVALALAYPAAKGVSEAQYPERRALGLRELGLRLRRDAGPGPLVLAGRDARMVAFHAGAAYVDIPPGPPAEALRALRAAGARHLVVFLRTRGPERPRALDRALLEAGAALVASAEATGDDDVRYHALAWRIDGSPP